MEGTDRMDAWISLCLCAAGFGADPAPSLNQPRPQTARPMPSSVVPVSHSFVVDESARFADIPPAPLPEFFDVEAPQIQFEFSRPESCTDSQVCPPAPPAELETAESSRSIGMFRLQPYKVQISLTEAQVFGCGELELNCPPAELPLTKAQIRHLRQAIEHLEAAGMAEAARELREQHQSAQNQLRQRQQRELDSKKEELKRLTEEVERLKADLMSDATIEFRMQHFTMNLKHLRELACGSEDEVQQAAQVVLARCDRQTPATEVKNDDQHAPYQAALRLLADQQHVSLESVLSLHVKNGQEAECRNVTDQILLPVRQLDGLMRFTTREMGDRLKLKADLLADHEIRFDGAYEHAACDRTTAVTFDGHDIPGLNAMKIRTQGTLEPGQTMCLGGLKFSRRSRDGNGVVTETEESNEILITAAVINTDSCVSQEPAFLPANSGAAAADGDEELSLSIQPSSKVVPTALTPHDFLDAWRLTVPQTTAPQIQVVPELYSPVPVTPQQNNPAQAPLSRMPILRPAPFSSMPVMRPNMLVNPQFYVGGAPQHVVEAWRNTFLPPAPSAETTAPEFQAPVTAPEWLIPDLETSGRPELLFLPAESDQDEPEFELPPAPFPDDPEGDDSDDVPVA